MIIIIIIIMILLSLDTAFENLRGLFDPAGFFASFSSAVFVRISSCERRWASGDPCSRHGLGVNAKSLPSGYVNSLLLKMAIEIVNFPIKMVIFHRYVKLPEGKSWSLDRTILP